MAKKYIDADKLKAEIERRKEEYKKDRYMSDYRGQIAYYKDEIYDDLLSFIDSLQQEQPCDTCTNDKGCVTCKDGELWEGQRTWIEQPSEDLEEEIKRYIPRDQCPVPDLMEAVARHFYELGKQSKEPVNEDLENAAREYATDTFPLSTEEYIDATAQDAFIAGAEWQKEQMGEQARKELAKTDITLADLVAFDEGLQLGRRLERQDMLKDAVEGYVNYYEDGGGKLMAEAQVGCPYHLGDKVKIVIIPEKEEEK